MTAAEWDLPRRRLGLRGFFRGRRATLVAAVVFAVLVLWALFFPWLSPYGPNDVDLDQSRLGPSLAHPLGTDQHGRDLLTRLAAGGRTSLTIAALALAIILFVGFLWGAAAALAGGVVDAALMRVVDGLFAIPRLPIAIVLLVALDAWANTIASMVLALSVVGWMLTARLVRGHVLALKAREFVKAARALGATWPSVTRRHVLPNSLGVLVVAIFLELPTVVIGEAFLSVFGLGPQPPTATWGTMARDGLHFVRLWEMTLATAAIVVFAVSANVLADGVGDALDPRRRQGSD